MYDLNDPFIDDSGMPDFDMQDLYEDEDDKPLKRTSLSVAIPEIRKPEPKDYYVYYGHLDHKRSKKTESTGSMKRASTALKAETSRKSHSGHSIIKSEEGLKKKEKSKKHQGSAKLSKLKDHPSLSNGDDQTKAKVSHKSRDSADTRSSSNIVAGNPPDYHASPSSQGHDLHSMALNISPACAPEDLHKLMFELSVSEYKAHITSIGGKVDLKNPRTHALIKRAVLQALVIPNYTPSSDKIAELLSIKPSGYALFQSRLLNVILPESLKEQNLALDKSMDALKSQIAEQVSNAEKSIPDPMLNTAAAAESSPPAISDSSQRLNESASLSLSWLAPIKALIFDAIEHLVTINCIENFLKKIPVRPMNARIAAYTRIASLWLSFLPSVDVSPAEISKRYGEYKKRTLKDFKKLHPFEHPTEATSAAISSKSSNIGALPASSNKIETKARKPKRKLVEADEISSAKIIRAKETQSKSLSDTASIGHKSLSCSGASSSAALEISPLVVTSGSPAFSALNLAFQSYRPSSDATNTTALVENTASLSIPKSLASNPKPSYPVESLATPRVVEGGIFHQPLPSTMNLVLHTTGMASQEAENSALTSSQSQPFKH